jgi:hypothetical protein
MNVWVLTREFGDSDTCLIVGIYSTQEKAEAAMAAQLNPEPIYGQLDISNWPVDD